MTLLTSINKPYSQPSKDILKVCQTIEVKERFRCTAKTPYRLHITFSNYVVYLSNVDNFSVELFKLRMKERLNRYVNNFDFVENSQKVTFLHPPFTFFSKGRKEISSILTQYFGIFII